MKQKIFYYYFLVMVLAILSTTNLSCKKEIEADSNNGVIAAGERNDKLFGYSKPVTAYSADVIISWLNMELNMLRVPLAPGATSQGAERAMAYCGIAAYESVVPGMPAYQSLNGQLIDFPEMPTIQHGKRYHWAASANAALAEMNRLLFPGASLANKFSIDSLETALNTSFTGETDAEALNRSISFGKEVATRIFSWSATDGSANVNPPYDPPIGPGLWVSTPPNFPTAANPYASQRRLMVEGVPHGTNIPLPPTYSTKPSSRFFAMVKDVYDRSQVLTPAQTAMALYHRDAPGYPGGGHFVAILSQIFSQSHARLDRAALIYAKTGLASYNAITICFTKKYQVNFVRPITYIRDVMGYTSWNALFNTPGHPEFPSAHAVNAAAIAVMLTSELGPRFHFTINSYEYLGLPAREYHSFYAMSKEMSDSRVFAGIHYQASCDKGLWLGAIVSRNILRNVKFLKPWHVHHD